MFSALREIIAAFSGPDPHLGLYGAFGYDLAFQFEPVQQRHDRPADQRDLVLHLPDRLYVLDRKRETAQCFSYEFEVGGVSTAGLDRAAGTARGSGGAFRHGDLPADPEPGSFARVVEQARERFARGDLFEVVPSHVFHGRAARRPRSTSGCGSATPHRTSSSSTSGRASTWSGRRRRCTSG